MSGESRWWLVAALCASTGVAEVVTDGRFGAGTALPGPNFLIPADLGRKSGGNLFHSFSALNLESSESATFSGPADVRNILARVTAGGASSIDGTLRSGISGANLFLINPKGIVLGRNARLDISGSFVATTADYVNLGTDGRFSATMPGDDVLTSAPPSAYGFLTATPRAIAVESDALLLKTGASCALIGGDLQLNNALLQVPTGSLHLVSVRSAGQVGLNLDDAAAIPQTGGFATLGNIISSGTIINAGTSERGARLVIRGGRLIADNSRFLVKTASKPGGAGVDVALRTSVSLSEKTLWSVNSSADSTGSTAAQFVTHSFTMAGDASLVSLSSASTGKAGGIRIDAGRLQLSNSVIVSNALGSGDGADVTITGTSASLIGSSTVVSASDASGNGGHIRLDLSGKLELVESALLSDANGAGEGGNVQVNVGSALVRGAGGALAAIRHGDGLGKGGDVSLHALGAVDLVDGGGVVAATEGAGRSGEVSVSSQSLSLTNGSVIAANTLSESEAGLAGNVSVDVTEEVRILGGSQISASTVGRGAAGQLTLTAGSLFISGAKSGLSAETTLPAVGGRGGRIGAVVQGAVEVRDGGLISTTSTGAGAGGSIALSAASVLVSGPQAAIGAQAQNTGAGGSIRLDIAGPLQVLEGANISTNATGAGAGGSVTVTANSIEVSAGASPLPTEISAGTASVEPGGGVSLNVVEKIELRERGRINVETLGAGAGGNVEIFARDLIISGERTGITAQTRGVTGGGRGGDIALTIRDAIDVSAGGVITAGTRGSGRGGDISIVSGNLSIAGAGSGIGSEALALTNGGNGGTITVMVNQLTITGALGSQVGVSTSTIGTGNAGAIDLRLGQLLVAESGTVESSTTGSGNGGAITVAATGLIGLSAGGTIRAGSLGSGNGGTISVNAGELSISRGATVAASTIGSGTAGNVNVFANQLLIRSGGTITAATTGSGDSGGVAIHAGNVMIDGRGSSGTGIVVDSGTTQSGASGGIVVEAGNVFLAGGRISANTASDSRGGGVKLDATRITLREGASIAASTSGLGNGGAIRVNADTLNIMPGSLITASTSGRGNGGDIHVGARRIGIDGGDSVSTGIIADSQMRRGGAGGDIVVTAQDLFLNGGTISANTASARRGGDVVVNAPRITLREGASIAASTSGRGNGGAIQLDADTLNISTSSLVTASTSGAGTGGNVRIDAGSVSIRGGDGAAGIFADSREITSGDGGSIMLSAGKIVLSDGAEISARTASAGSGGDIAIDAENLALKNRASINTSASGSGIAGGIRFRIGGSLQLGEGSSVATTSRQSNAGLIDVRAGGTVRLEDSSITVQASLGDAGQIAIRTPQRIELKRSGIIAEAGGSGGNIALDAAFLDLDSSRISANAVAGDGGIITLNIPATGVLGDSRNFVIVSEFVRQTGDSRISASSELGLQGALLIQAPELDLSNAVEGFSASLVDASTQLREQCARRYGMEFSSFLVIGRGGVSLGPDEALVDTGARTTRQRAKAKRR